MTDTSTKNFMDYFCGFQDYPKGIAFSPLPVNILYNYISNTFLNGFINYVTIVKAFVIGRYHDWDEEFEEPVEKGIKQESDWENKTFKTKNELYNVFTHPDVACHAELDNDFQDDVLILSKTHSSTDNSYLWVYFWFDRDCSDCSIGRFQTEDSDEAVIASFEKYVKELKLNEYGHKEIPLHYFRGWMSS